MDTPDRPLDRSTASLSDPLPDTPAAAAMRAALPDSTVRPEAVHPHGLHAPTHDDHDDRPGRVDARGDERGAGADPDADGRRAGEPAGDEIGEAVGGISGVLTGAAIGSLGGPIGTIIGGIAGAVSGWWAGRAISEAAYHATHDDEEHYRTGHAAPAGAARSYDDVRPAYQVGHLAGRNPDYAGRTFEEVEPDLRHGWSAHVSARHGPWDEAREYARMAFERSRAQGAGGAVPPVRGIETRAPGPGGPPTTAVGGAASGVAATGGAAGTATGGTRTEGSARAPETGSLDVGAASRADGA
jgi:hypothetical protein